MCVCVSVNLHTFIIEIPMSKFKTFYFLIAGGMTFARYIPGLMALGAMLAAYKIFDVAEVIHEYSKKEVADKYDIIIGQCVLIIIIIIITIITTIAIPVHGF